jgi:hypothetical protein
MQNDAGFETVVPRGLVIGELLAAKNEPLLLGRDALLLLDALLDRAHHIVEVDVDGDLLARDRLDLDRAACLRHHHVDLWRNIDTGDVHIVQLDMGNADVPQFLGQRSDLGRDPPMHRRPSKHMGHDRKLLTKSRSSLTNSVILCGDFTVGNELLRAWYREESLQVSDARLSGGFNLGRGHEQNPVPSYLNRKKLFTT